MKILSRSELELILFLFPSALLDKEGATQCLHGFSQLFPTLRKDCFCGDAFQRLFNHFWCGGGNQSTQGQH